MMSRRTPLQPRSRESVQNILGVAADLILNQGIDALTTSAVAKNSGISVGTLYQYFADRDAIIARLVGDHVEALNHQLMEELEHLETLSIRTIVETAMNTHVSYDRANPGFVQMWVHGKTSGTVLARQRERNVAMSKWLREVVDKFGMVRENSPELGAWFAVEIADRVIEMAFRHDPKCDPEMIREGTEMIVVYLDRYATTVGRDGVPVMGLPKAPSGF